MADISDQIDRHKELTQAGWKKVLGPCEESPRVAILSEQGRNYLFRAIHNLDKKPVLENPEQSYKEKMGLGKWVLYFLWLYTPPKNTSKPVHRTSIFERVYDEPIRSFQIVNGREALSAKPPEMDLEAFNKSYLVYVR